VPTWPSGPAIRAANRKFLPLADHRVGIASLSIRSGKLAAAPNFPFALVLLHASVSSRLEVKQRRCQGLGVYPRQASNVEPTPADHARGAMHQPIDRLPLLPAEREHIVQDQHLLSKICAGVIELVVFPMAPPARQTIPGGERLRRFLKSLPDDPLPARCGYDRAIP
jgi:hypothetical protein